jgi:hypothetical protein
MIILLYVYTVLLIVGATTEKRDINSPFLRNESLGGDETTANIALHLGY